VEMGEGRTPRPEPSAGDLLRACPMLCRRPDGRPSAVCRPVQSRAPGSGLVSGYATLTGAASPLHDASTAHGEEAASTLTLPPKRRGREQAGGCQLLRFAAGLTRPDGTSARILRGSGPVAVLVRSPVSSGIGFSRLSFGGLRDRMCPRSFETTTTSGSTSLWPAS
jgi:hypothetical protein